MLRWLAFLALLTTIIIGACADDGPSDDSTPRPERQETEFPQTPLTIDEIEGETLADIMGTLYRRQMRSHPTVCSYVLGTGVYGVSQPLDRDTHPAQLVADLVQGWTGSIWIGEFGDYELSWTEPQRIVLVAPDGVSLPHQGFYDTIGDALEFKHIRGEFELTTIGRLFDCSDPNGAYPDGIGELAQPHSGDEGLFVYDVEEVVDIEHGTDSHVHQRYEILEVRDPKDWPPAVEAPEIAELLTEVARETWFTEFVCVDVTRWPAESGDAGTRLLSESPLPEGLLAIFADSRLDPSKASLSVVSENNVILAWVESYDDAGWVYASEVIRESAGQWIERTSVSMYGCGPLGSE